MRYLLTLAFLATLAVSAQAGYRELFEREFTTTPWAIVKWEGSACIDCHTSDQMEKRFQDVPAQWRKSWHYRNNVGCHDCHGGDPEDAAMSMSHQRGFQGVPTDTDIPGFCGKCHRRILEHYETSGHGQALQGGRGGPTCVTCHGSHNIQQANIEIINEALCSRCHPYERAKLMKQALFHVESRLGGIRKQLEELKKTGTMIDQEEKAFFNTHSEFRALFHSVDVTLVKEKTDDYNKRMDAIEADIGKIFGELGFRRNFAAYLFVLFTAMGIVCHLLTKTEQKK